MRLGLGRLLLILACLGGVALLYVVFVLRIPGQLVDQRWERRAGDLPVPLRSVAAHLLQNTPPTVYVGALVLVIVLGLLLRRPMPTAVGTVAALGCLGLVKLLKVVLYRPPLVPPLVDDRFPSGHTAAVGGLAVALLVVVRRAWRAWAGVLGALAMVATGFGLVVSQYHRPSDVVASMLIAVAFGIVALSSPRSRSD